MLIKKRIFISIDWFTPGFRAGGPIKSIVNFCEAFKNEFEIFIYTSDRDLGTAQPYPVKVNSWVVNNGVNVFYSSPPNQNRANLKKQLASVAPNFIYINSIFSKHYSIDVLLIQKHFPKIKYIVAPRGMLKQSALNFKKAKKVIFLKVANIFSLYKNIVFQATDEVEAADIQKQIQSYNAVTQIGNLPQKPQKSITYLPKAEHFLRIIFVGRIHPIKNLKLALQSVNCKNCNIHFTIVGLLEDKEYWEQCNEEIKNFGSNITVNYLAEVEPLELQKIVANNHILFLPTQGENFGHAIYESLCTGRPAVISDQTPWQNLEAQQAGFDVALKDEQKFKNCIEFFANMNQQKYNVWCDGAHNLANNYYNHSDTKTKYLTLFN